MRDVVVVAFLHVQVDLLNNELALLVPLGLIISLSIRPTYHTLAPLTKDITYTMQARDQLSVFGWANNYIHTLIKQVSSACGWGGNT